MRITVLLADDHVVVRQGLRVLLESDPELVVVAEADTGRQAVQLAKKHLPDVVVMDIAMPVMNGLEATRQIMRESPSSKVLILSSYDDTEYVSRLTEAGAVGYLVKHSASNELLAAIREVRKGNAYFSPSISRRMINNFRDAFYKRRPAEKQGEHLTSREGQVLQLIAEGRANKQIAEDLAISIKTVEKHRQQVMNKLHIHEVAGLTRYAIAKGIIQCEAMT
ncbi:MAG: response regulator transcription factor [Verrucomicrobiota bacterium]